MSGESDLINLYSERILELATNVPHVERLDNPDATAKKRSPLCGSTVTVDIALTDGKIKDYAQDVKACALGQAAAAVIAARESRPYRTAEYDEGTPAPPREQFGSAGSYRSCLQNNYAEVRRAERSTTAEMYIAQRGYWCH